MVQNLSLVKHERVKQVLHRKVTDAKKNATGLFLIGIHLYKIFENCMLPILHVLTAIH